MYFIEIIMRFHYHGKIRIISLTDTILSLLRHRPMPFTISPSSSSHNQIRFIYTLAKTRSIMMAHNHQNKIIARNFAWYS